MKSEWSLRTVPTPVPGLARCSVTQDSTLERLGWRVHRTSAPLFNFLWVSNYFKIKSKNQNHPQPPAKNKNIKYWNYIFDFLIFAERRLGFILSLRYREEKKGHFPVERISRSHLPSGDRWGRTCIGQGVGQVEGSKGKRGEEKVGGL